MKASWMKRQQYLGYLFIGPNMIGVILFFIIPAVYSFYLMFTDYKFMSPHTKFIGLANIQRMLGMRYSISPSRTHCCSWSPSRYQSASRSSLPLC